MSDFEPSSGIRPRFTEMESRMEEISNPKEYLERFFNSNTYQQEFEQFTETRGGLRPELVKELEEKYHSDEVIEKKRADLQKYFFLNSKDIVFVVDEFRAFDKDKAKFKYDPSQYSVQTREAIEMYMDQVRSLNKRDQDALEKAEIVTMGSIKGRYHNEAAEKLAEELMEKGLLPRPLPDMPTPIPFGRALVSELTYTKLGVQHS